MVIYGLIADGFCRISGRPRKIYSRNMFRTKEDAISKMDEFKIRCTDDNNLFNLQATRVDIDIAEYELND